MESPNTFGAFASLMAEYNSRSLQNIINHLVKLGTRLAGVISIKKNNCWQWLWISVMCVLDNRPQHCSIGEFANSITIPSNMERNRLDRLRQHADGTVAVFGRHKI